MALLTNINGKFSVSDVGAVTFNNAFTFPTADGAANYVLQTNGSGQIAWAENGNGDISGSGDSNYVTKFTGAKTIGNGPITFSGTGSVNSTFAGNITGTSAQFIDTTNPDGGGGAGEGGSLTIEGRRDGTANLISLRARDASAPAAALPDGQGGLIRWQGFDGTDFAQMGAIAVVADGQAVANSDAPSKMIFYTTADGGEALTTALTLDKSQNATFAGDVLIEDNIYLTDAGTTRAKIQLNSSDRDNLDIKAISLGSEINFFTVDTLALTLDANQNATFASAVWIPDYIYHVGDANSKFGFSGNDTFVINTSGTTALTIDASRNATFTATVTAPTFLGDLNGTINTATTAVTQPNATDNTKVATTAYVVNKIAELPAGLVFLGTWDADNNTPTLASGGGERSEGTTTTVTANKLIDSAATFTTAPAVVVGDRVRVVTPAGPEFALVASVDSATQLTLAADIVTATGEAYILEVSPFIPEGNYYIVSTSGDTDLNGIDVWSTGDWVVASSTNVWQKIINSSVLNGTGTGQKVTKWDGSGDSNTLTNGPITFATNNSTFAGNITFGDGHFIGDDGDDNLLIQSSANENIIIDSADDIILDAGGDDIKLNVSGTEYGKFNNDSSNLNIFSSIQDKDIVFRGNDGGSSITALTLDMSNGGSATFRDDIDFGGKLTQTGTGNNTFAGNITGVGASFIGAASSGAALVTIENNSGSTATSYGLLVKGGGNSASGKTFEVRDDNGNTDLIVKGNGNVGIGTDSPTNPLSVEATNVSDWVAEFKQGHSTAGQSYGVNIFGGASSSDAAFQVCNQAGSGLLRVTGAGSVGIGFTDPGNYKLKVNGAISGTNIYANSAGGSFVFGASTSEGEYITRPNATNNICIVAGGNVGIGTTSPDYKLEVQGVISSADAGLQKATFANVGNDLVLTSNADATNVTAKMLFNSSGAGGAAVSTKMIIDSFGNVGIGTSSPGDFDGESRNLVIRAGVNGTNPTVGITIAGDGNQSSTGRGAIRFADGISGNERYRGALEYDHAGDDMFFRTSGAVKMTIDTDGNVGIGTTSPYLKLHVDGDTRVQGNLMVGDASASNTPAAVIHIKSSGTNAKLRIEDSDNANQYWDFLVDQGNALYFNEDTDTRVTFKEGGNVGIGDTTPSYKLDVDGTIRATGDVIAYSDVRVKENIKTIDNSLEKVSKLRGVEFNKIGNNEKSIGVIAQEIEKVIPEVVKEDDKGMKSVAYGNISGLLIEAIKELKAEIEELKLNKCNCNK